MTADLDSQSDLVSPPQRSGAPRAGALDRARFDNGPAPCGKIGRYALLGQLAGGGMGSVYLALMRGPAAFSRLVAIKCLHTRWLDDPKYVARFATEVRLTTRIRHPNVVEALDVVEEGGELFLVMEYVDGVTLSALLADLSRLGRPLPVTLATALMSAVLRGLHAAHETTDEHGARLDIVHRDVSPQNIMVSRSGHVQVLDFGAAKAIDHSQHTAAGVLVGKLAYMAPEQVHGERSSPRTDIFAAGIVLWEALAGRRLFFDPSLERGELLQALVRKPIVRPGLFRPDVPRALDVVVKRALDRNPRRRYQSALELAEALDVFAAGASQSRLGSLVSDVCAARLGDKDELLRAGMASLEAEPSPSTPVAPALPAVGHVGAAGQAIVVPAGQHTLPGLVLSAAPRPRHGARWRWLASVALALAAAFGWWGFGLRVSREPRPARPGFPPAAREALPALDVASSPLAPPVAPTSFLESAPLPGPAPSHALPSASPPASAANARGSDARPAGRVRRRGDAHDRELCDPPTYMDASGIRHFKKGCV